jgi:hypothetical protein
MYKYISNMTNYASIVDETKTFTRYFQINPYVKL